MDFSKTELLAILHEFNPWWSGRPTQDLPTWERKAVQQVCAWARDNTITRILLLSGARQTGKTTIFRQSIGHLLKNGVEPTDIIYVTFDHPILKLAGIDRTLDAWREAYPGSDKKRFLFLDEIQFLKEWETWVKHHVDFKRHYRIAATGSATSLKHGSIESGLGRIETIPLPTMSFREFLQLRDIPEPSIGLLKHLSEIYSWNDGQVAEVRHKVQPLTPYFHEYLIRGGFPEPALQKNVVRTQRLLREDIVDKALKRDMTAYYGVRRVLELEKLFLYLCLHDGGMTDLGTIASNLENTNRQTVSNYLDNLEGAHLIYRLKPYGYGKEVLRGRNKIYLSDAAIPGAVTLLGEKLLSNPLKLAAAVETAFFKHLYTRYYSAAPNLAYWVGKKDHEVDVVADFGDRVVPFEVKYQDSALTGADLVGLRMFCEKHEPEYGYVITQRWTELGPITLTSAKRSSKETIKTKTIRVPATLACLLLS